MNYMTMNDIDNYLRKDIAHQITQDVIRYDKMRCDVIRYVSYPRIISSLFRLIQNNESRIIKANSMNEMSTSESNELHIIYIYSGRVNQLNINELNIVLGIFFSHRPLSREKKALILHYEIKTSYKPFKS